MKIHSPFEPRRPDGRWASADDIGPECEITLKGAATSAVDKTWVQVKADASYLPDGRVSGTAHSIQFKGKTSAPLRIPAVRGKGAIHAELLAVVRALRQARQLEAQKIRLYTDNMVVLKFLCRFIHPRKPDFVALVEEAVSILDSFSEVRVAHLRTSSMRRVDRRARRAAQTARERKAATQARRSLRLEQRVEASRTVGLAYADGRWMAAGRFAVTIEPMSCECFDWKDKWSRIPVEGRRKNRVPCKHIIRLARELGVPVDRLDFLAKFAES